MQIHESNQFFDQIYKNANTDESKVPWATLQTNPFLEEYLSMNIGEGKAIVIGCGLGDDAYALEEAGFDVTAIDISSTAIEWCKKRYDYTNIDFQVQDIFALPDTMLEGYDFVFECRTIQSLALMHRNRIIGAISSLLAPNGRLLAIANGKREGERHDGPPWPLEQNELKLFQNHGLNELEFSIFAEESPLSSLKFRALYHKPH